MELSIEIEISKSIDAPARIFFWSFRYISDYKIVCDDFIVCCVYIGRLEVTFPWIAEGISRIWINIQWKVVCQTKQIVFAYTSECINFLYIQY